MIDSPSFASRLDLVLKLLAISGGRLAADLGIDKSVTSRWLRGQSVPSGENRSRLTRYIADLCPGFSGLTWDADHAAIASLFPQTQLPIPAAAAPYGLQLPGIEPPDLDSEAAQALCGHWHAWRLAELTHRNGALMRDIVRLRHNAGRIEVDFASGPMRGTGEAVVGIGRACMLITANVIPMPLVMWLNTLVHGRMQVMDGMMSCMATHWIITGAYVLVRHADILGDLTLDDHLFYALAAEPAEFAVADAPADIVRRLSEPYCENSVYRVPGATALTHARTAEEEAAAAAVSAAFMAGLAR